MLASETLLGARQSFSTAVATVGILLDPEGYIVSSETASTSWGAGLEADAAGVVGTPQVFRATVPAQVDQDSPRVAPKINLRVPWTLTAQSPNAATGSIRASLFVNGVLVGAAVEGGARNLNAGNGTLYTEIMTIEIAAASMAVWTPGTTVDIVLQPIVTVAGVAGSTFEPTLRHDPQVVDNQLVVEFQGLKGVV